jgi:ABC-type lipoprotein export system ATPase subunit
MDLFTRLNAEQKKTILLITHDAHVASYAQKTVPMKD